MRDMGCKARRPRWGRRTRCGNVQAMLRGGWCWSGNLPAKCGIQRSRPEGVPRLAARLLKPQYKARGLKYFALCSGFGTWGDHCGRLRNLILTQHRYFQHIFVIERSGSKSHSKKMKERRPKRVAAPCTSLYQETVAGNQMQKRKKERNKPEPLSRPGLPSSNQQRPLRLHPRKERLNSGLCRFPSHDVDHEPKVIPPSSVRVQVLVNHLPPSPPQSFAIASTFVENVFPEHSLKQPEGKFRIVGRRNGCENLVKEGGEYVEFCKVRIKFEPSESFVATQVDGNSSKPLV